MEVTREIHASLLCVSRALSLLWILKETFVQAKLLLVVLVFFYYLVVNLKVNCSNGLGRKMVSLVFPDIYLCLFSNSTSSQVVLLSDI